MDFVYRNELIQGKLYSLNKNSLINLFGEDFKNKFILLNIEVKRIYDSTDTRKSELNSMLTPNTTNNDGPKVQKK